MKHAGIHFPENAGGEHPNIETILGMPGISHGCTLICAPSARYWYRQARGASPLVVWRAIPRQGALPAQLNWIGKRVADECLNLWDEQPHGGIEHFTPLNELQFVKEAGEVFRSYAETASKLSNVRIALRQRFDALGQTVRLMFPAWVPQDDMDRILEWEDEARQWDTIGLHCYGSAETMRTRYDSYRAAFPDHPIFVGEWNANHEGHDEHAALQMWAEVSNTDPGFTGATYYIWETRNQGEADLSIWGNPARLVLFQNPPTVAEPEDPVEPEDPEMPTLDPWQYWTPDALATLIQCPRDAVATNWPKLCEQLGHVARQTGQDIFLTKDTLVALASTVAIETAHRFQPIHEYRMADGSIPAYWYTYDGGPEYHGRGFIQNTHKYNYADLGPKIAALWGAGPNDFDFVARPDDLLDPDLSAAASAIYFRDHAREDGDGIPEAASRGDWRAVRQLVQGADAGLTELISYATALGGTVVPPVDDTTSYSVNVPDDVVLQQNNWSCAVRSTYAALWAMAQVAQGEPVTYGDEGLRDVYEWMVPALADASVGLHDGSGAQLAAMLRDKGYDAESVYPCSIEQVRERAGTEPVLIGGAAWNHWSYVRGKHADGGLILENPSPGHDGITDYIRDSWGRLGPFSAVFIRQSVPVEPEHTLPTYEDLANLEGVAYHDNGVVIPALEGAKAVGDWSQVDAVVKFLRDNDPHKAA
jgi:hypothetical protein